MKNLQGVDIHCRLGVELYISQDFFRKFITGIAAKGNKHGLRKRAFQELVHHRKMFSDKWNKTSLVGAESQGYCKFQKESEVEVAEILFESIQQKDIMRAPLVQSLLRCPFLQYLEKHLAHEHRDGVLVYVPSYAVQGAFCRDVPRREQIGLRRFDYISFQDVQWKEKGHLSLSGTAYKKASPSIIPAQGMDDERVLSELRGM